MCTFEDMGNIPCLANEGLWSLTILVCYELWKERNTRIFLLGCLYFVLLKKNQRWGIPLDCGGFQASGQTCSKDMCTVLVCFFWCDFCAFLRFCLTGKANFVKPPLGYYYFLIQRSPASSFKKKGHGLCTCLLNLLSNLSRAYRIIFFIAWEELPYLVPY